jgi:hypothetical protein
MGDLIYIHEMFVIGISARIYSLFHLKINLDSYGREITNARNGFVNGRSPTMSDERFYRLGTKDRFVKVFEI